MTYVADFDTEDGIRRVFAHTNDDGSIRKHLSGATYTWANAEVARKLLQDGDMSSDDADAMRQWWEELSLRGVGETAERAKRVAASGA